jgi:putative FmdB family regulatory protein
MAVAEGISMPLYEYVCTACGNSLDRVVPHAQADRPGPCPECEGSLRRRYSRVAVKLEGWGFARNDAMVPDKPGRADFKTIRDRAERISEGGS